MTGAVNLTALWPALAPALAALAVLLLDVAVPRARTAHLVVVALGLAGGAVATVPGLVQAAEERRQAFCTAGDCLWSAGSLASGLQLLALLATGVVLALAWSDWSDDTSGVGRPAVVSALALGATTGAVAVPAAADLASLLISLELATLPTVVLVALERRSEGAADAVDGAVSLLTTSVVSFGVLALGAALWVAATGTALLAGPSAAAALERPSHGGLLTVGAVLMLAGIAFKVSAVPFHAWTPLTYQRAPVVVSTYLAAVSKTAAVGALIVLVLAVGSGTAPVLVGVGVLAALSMSIGNVVALRQHDLIALLAWSSIAQGGWMLLPLSAVSDDAAGAARAAGGYLAVYAVATLLAFVVVVAVAALPGREPGQESGHRLEAQRALLSRHPVLALPLGMALLTLAGLPPAVVGLVAKVVALGPVAGEGTWWLAVVAALNVALGIAVYLRWLAVVIARPEPADALTEQARQDDQEPEQEPATRHTPQLLHSVLAVLLGLVLVAGSIVPVGVF